jgi:hypothetical protein
MIRIGHAAGYDEFLEDLLTFESGVDPRKSEWYKDNWMGCYGNYPRVLRPGRVIRDEDGAIIFDMISVGEYLAALGVATDPRLLDFAYLSEARYRVINPLGFIGFQLGEALLIDTGYYCAEQIATPDGRELSAYYRGDVPQTQWSNGTKETIWVVQGGEEVVLATDVNRWRGAFLGRNGVGSIADLVVPEIARGVMDDLVSYQFAKIHELVEEQLTAMSGRAKDVAVHRAREALQAECISGLLAAAHLVGALGVAKYVMAGQDAHDEFGTTLTTYIDRFKGYNISHARLGQIL